MKNSFYPLLFICSCSNDKANPTDTSQIQSPTEDTEPVPFACTYVEAPNHGSPGTVEFGVEIVADNLFTPWGLDWLPNGDMLLTERDGVISRISNGVVHQIANAPIVESGEGGLLGLAIDPEFEINRSFYVYYTTAKNGSVVNRVSRWELSDDGNSATEEAVIVDDIAARQFHNGGRLRIGPDRKLYIGTGDAGQPDYSQDPTNLAGKILRVNIDGSIPDDNPFPGEATWILGIRNTQGFDWRHDDKMLITDHGPSGIPNENGRSDHDEVSLAAGGENLGWPNIYACEEEEGFVTPSITWGKALPPGGAAMYRGTEIPEWEGDLIIGVLGIDETTPQLHRLRVNTEGNIERSEVYLQGDNGYGRLREVVMGPDGGLYVTTSNCDGRGTCGQGDMILRLGAAN